MKKTLLCLSVMTSACAATAAEPAQDATANYAKAALERNYAAGAPGAALLVARGDTVLFRGARGEADVAKSIPLQPDSVFRIGSVTKQFAAAGVLTLVEAGKVRLDDPLSKYVPDYPNGAQITVQELLNHTAGVKSYTELPGYMEGRVREDRTTAQMIDVFDDLPPDFAPGTQWKYSNSGYVLVGAIIEAASGMPWPVYLGQALFEPLGMQDTGHANDPRFTSRLVHGYTYEDGKVADAHAISMTQPHAAGSLVSTLDDLLKWNRALHEGRILRDATYRRMITPEGGARQRGYGYGLYTDDWRGHPVLRHGGGIFGFVSSFAYVPGDDITVIVLENDDAPDAPESADDLARKIAAVALGDPYPEAGVAARTATVPRGLLERLVGAYAQGGMTLKINLVGDVLQAQLGDQPAIPLTPTSPTEFDVADSGATLEFTAGQGAAASVTMRQRGRALVLPRVVGGD
ncbi:Beta-lactamase [Lysobacter dokdonensis DS-58]|uniref:Beta-lactamase n=1 Tax=Lysobacter dokdonensis DS-58 TaxID=1300345 RepID=A0A0A2WM47_9GAMM|nr:serine hydrolase domain-containing protein [Lysobacter dokdonensis]KGQ19360.1 Beta-lactamase [Lysobacter dokdonensis DS-58]